MQVVKVGYLAYTDRSSDSKPTAGKADLLQFGHSGPYQLVEERSAVQSMTDIVAEQLAEKSVTLHTDSKSLLY